jgi:hypothetical protein
MYYLFFNAYTYTNVQIGVWWRLATSKSVGLTTPSLPSSNEEAAASFAVAVVSPTSTLLQEQPVRVSWIHP